MSLTKVCRPSSLLGKPSGISWNFNDEEGSAPSNIDPGDPVSHDEATSYRGCSQPYRGDWWACATGKPAVEVVHATSYSAVRARGQSGYYPDFYFAMSVDSGAIGSTGTLATGAGWQTGTQTAQPTPAQVNDANFGMIVYVGSMNPVIGQYTSAWIVLDYEPPGFCFIPLWALLGSLGLLGSGVGHEHMAKIAAWFRRHEELTIPPSDFARVLRSWRTHRAPRFAFQGF